MSSGDRTPLALDVDFWAQFILISGLATFLFAGLYGGLVMQISTYVVVLELVGLVLGLSYRQLVFVPGKAKRDSSRRIFFYAGMGFVGIVLADLFVSLVPVNLGILGVGVGGNQFIGLMISQAEEVYFRGFFMPWLVNRLGEKSGLAAQAGLFAIYHTVIYADNPIAILFVFLSGWVLGYIDLRSRSLAPSMIAHFLNQLFATGLI